MPVTRHTEDERRRHRHIVDSLPADAIQRMGKYSFHLGRVFYQDSGLGIVLLLLEVDFCSKSANEIEDLLQPLATFLASRGAMPRTQKHQSSCNVEYKVRVFALYYVLGTQLNILPAYGIEPRIQGETWKKQLPVVVRWVFGPNAQDSDGPVLVRLANQPGGWCHVAQSALDAVAGPSAAPAKVSGGTVTSLTVEVPTTGHGTDTKASGSEVDAATHPAMPKTDNDPTKEPDQELVTAGIQAAAPGQSLTEVPGDTHSEIVASQAETAKPVHEEEVKSGAGTPDAAEPGSVKPMVIIHETKPDAVESSSDGPEPQSSTTPGTESAPCCEGVVVAVRPAPCPTVLMPAPASGDPVVGKPEAVKTVAPSAAEDAVAAADDVARLVLRLMDHQWDWLRAKYRISWLATALLSACPEITPDEILRLTVGQFDLGGDSPRILIREKYFAISATLGSELRAHVAAQDLSDGARLLSVKGRGAVLPDGSAGPAVTRQLTQSQWKKALLEALAQPSPERAI